MHIAWPRSFILCAACRTIKPMPRFTKLRTSPRGSAWFIQSNSRKHTRNACGLQCIPVCILNLGYLPAPDQISSVIVAGPVRSHAHNLSTRSSTNLGLGGPTCENQAADIPRSREFSNKSGIKMRFLCTPTDRDVQCRGQCRGHRRAGDRRRGKWNLAVSPSGKKLNSITDTLSMLTV